MHGSTTHGLVRSPDTKLFARALRRVRRARAKNLVWGRDYLGLCVGQWIMEPSRSIFKALILLVKDYTQL